MHLASVSIWPALSSCGAGVNCSAMITCQPPCSQALAEKLHELVRREVWGYAADESMSVDDMLKVGGKGGTGGEGAKGGARCAVWCSANASTAPSCPAFLSHHAPV